MTNGVRKCSLFCYSSDVQTIHACKSNLNVSVNKANERKPVVDPVIDSLSLHVFTNENNFEVRAQWCMFFQESSTKCSIIQLNGCVTRMNICKIIIEETVSGLPCLLWNRLFAKKTIHFLHTCIYIKAFKKSM